MAWVRLAAVCSVLGLGCATALVAAPFFCRGPVFERPALLPRAPQPRVTDGPVGKLELQLLEPRLQRPPSRPEDGTEDSSEWYGAQHLRVIADSVPLSTVALALSNALGVNVELEAEIASARVFVFDPDTTVRDLLSSIGRSYGCHASVDRAGVHLSSEQSWSAQVLGLVGSEPLKIRLLSVAPRIGAAHFADIHCRDLGSGRGSATAIGDTVMIKDTVAALARAEGLLQRLEQLEGRSPPARSPKGARDVEPAEEGLVTAR